MKPDTSPARSEYLLCNITKAVTDHDQERTRQAVDRVLTTATKGWGGHPSDGSAFVCGCFEPVPVACECGCESTIQTRTVSNCPRDSLGDHFRAYRPVASFVSLYSYEAVEDTYELRQEMNQYRPHVVVLWSGRYQWTT